MLRSKMTFLATSLCFAAVAAYGAGIPGGLATGTYTLLNHPDGEIRTPYYGLRLDGLDGNNSNRYTFDFEHAQSNMQMTYNGSTIHIFGNVWGGKDIGSSYQNPSQGRTGLWQVDFTYRANVSANPNGSIQVNSSPTNNGFIKPLFNSTVAAFQNNPQIPLIDFMDPSFLLDTGHRGFAGISGWGWVNHSGRAHVPASDWLFTVGAQVIPTPGAASLGMIGLALVNGLRRRLA